MDKKVIYSKQYPRPNFAAIFRAIMEEESENVTDIDGESLEDILNEAAKDNVWVPMPEREKAKEAFINEAIAFSQLLKLDIDVIERAGAVDIHFHVYRAAYFLERIKQVFDLADRISIIDKSDDDTVELCLTLYTHKHLSATGEQITP